MKQPIHLTGDIWVIPIPHKINNPHFYRVNNEAIMFKWDDVEHTLNPYTTVRVDYFRGDLKNYTWPEFICTSDEATEEVAKKIVGEHTYNGKYYNNVPPDTIRGQAFSVAYCLDTALESLQSLLKSKGLKGNYAIINYK